MVVQASNTMFALSLLVLLVLLMLLMMPVRSSLCQLLRQVVGPDAPT